MKIELLAPAGSCESLKAALNAGADAVYIGGTRFGARAYADNPGEEELLRAMDECHLRGKRLYLTVNTLLKEREMDGLYDYLLPYYRNGLDAVIVQDLGVFSFIREAFPDLQVHASTQMTVTGADGAGLLKRLGASRVVTARELSLEEVRRIRDEVDIEIESFVHGALCYCYSGQCLYSSLIGGRSGNRGRCAQPCRLPYDLYKDGVQKNHGADKFLLSPKDMCALDLIPELAKAGIDSFKIEGRMKKPAYTAGVVRIYRKYLDLYLQNGPEGFHVGRGDRLELMDLYNRGGFSTGYYKVRNGREMMSLVRPNHMGTEAAKVVRAEKNGLRVKALEDLHPGDVLELYDKDSNQKGAQVTLKEVKNRGESFDIRLFVGKKAGSGCMMLRTRNESLLKSLEEEYLHGKFQEKLNGKLRLHRDNPAILEIKMGRFAAEVQGEAVSGAINQPISLDKVKKQMQKTGGTPFAFERLEVEMDEDIFIPVQVLNELRRTALERLERDVLDSFRREAFAAAPMSEDMAGAGQRRTEDGRRLDGGRKMALRVSLESLEAFDELVGMPGVSGIYLDCCAFQNFREFLDSRHYAKRCHQAGKQCYYIMPHIFRLDTKKYYETDGAKETLACFDGILVKNLEELEFLKGVDGIGSLAADHNLYTFNRISREFLRGQGITYDTVPLELNDSEILQRGCLGSELVVYGRLPMMASVQCQKKTVGDCDKKPGILYLRDRKGKDFPVKNHCQFCYNTIYNSTPLVLLEQWRRIGQMRPGSVRLEFTVEAGTEVVSITKSYIDAFCEGKYSGLGLAEFTRGHFTRGVE